MQATIDDYEIKLEEAREKMDKEHAIIVSRSGLHSIVYFRSELEAVFHFI